LMGRPKVPVIPEMTAGGVTGRAGVTGATGVIEGSIGTADTTGVITGEITAVTGATGAADTRGVTGATTADTTGVTGDKTVVTGATTVDTSDVTGARADVTEVSADEIGARADDTVDVKDDVTEATGVGDPSGPGEDSDKICWGRVPVEPAMVFAALVMTVGEIGRTGRIARTISMADSGLGMSLSTVPSMACTTWTSLSTEWSTTLLTVLTVALIVSPVFPITLSEFPSGCGGKVPSVVVGTAEISTPGAGFPLAAS
jgi:hypothetical protein